MEALKLEITNDTMMVHQILKCNRNIEEKENQIALAEESFTDRLTNCTFYVLEIKHLEKQLSIQKSNDQAKVNSSMFISLFLCSLSSISSSNSRSSIMTSSSSLSASLISLFKAS